MLLAFLLGVLGGLVVGRSYYGQQRNRPSREEVRKEFTEKLKLSAQQRVDIDSILETHRKKFGELRKQYSDTFRAGRDSLRAEIRKLLSAEQNKLYDAYIKELEERESRDRERHDR